MFRFSDAFHSSVPRATYRYHGVDEHVHFGGGLDQRFRDEVELIARVAILVRLPDVIDEGFSLHKGKIVRELMCFFLFFKCLCSAHKKGNPAGLDLRRKSFSPSAATHRTCCRCSRGSCPPPCAHYPDPVDYRTPPGRPPVSVGLRVR